MTHSDAARREIEALRERIATLSAAILRINATLDLETVLAEVVESARGLTGARYGVIATLDEIGEPTRESVFSGFTSEEKQEVFAWPDNRRLFDHLRHLPGPLRLADLAGYVQSLGIAPARMFSRTFQGTPMRHRGTDIGHFFLADKADGEEFTDDDEEVLTLFASQAAAAIANARAHRSERRARADLEALVETSPVGVVVFDAAGRPASFNREARRIVERLLMPGHSTEQLLEVIACRRADGREVSLAEFPLADQFAATPETVRAEEMVLWRVTLRGEALDLTATEYELLRLLSLDAGRVVTFETLLRRVWAKSDRDGANLVRNFVRNLRRKLGDGATSPAYLFNERGVGYRMAKPTE